MDTFLAHQALARRRFLALASTFAAGAAIAPRSAACASQPATSPPTNAPATPPAPDAVTPETIAHAQKLAGISFTAPEQEMMTKTLPEQIAMFKSRQSLGALPNDLSPALTFNPRSVGSRRQEGTPVLLLSSEMQTIPPLPDSDVDIAYAPITLLGQWIKTRQLTSTRLTQIYLDRLKRLDPKLNAVVTLTEEHALGQAAKADVEINAGKYRGRLHGIPYGAKDLLDTANIRTTWGAEPWRDRVPTKDAEVIRKLTEAGAVLVAKLSLGAIANGDVWFEGRTNNPWKLDEGSSGSSAGSAACVTAGLVAFAIGSETYGSILSPSMRCGTTGLRPTFGRVSRQGAMALCWSLDKLGPITRTVEDALVVLMAIQSAENDPRDGDPSVITSPIFGYSANAPLTSTRIGYNPAWFKDEPATDLDRAALETLKSLGAKLVEIDLPKWPYECLIPILVAEAASAFEDLTRADLDDQLKSQEPDAWPNTFRQSWFIPANELIQADRFRRMCMKMMAERFQTLTAIIAPSFAASLCLITNFTGHPQLTIRCGFKEDGAPHGITLWGALDQEQALCHIGHRMEQAMGVWNKRPSIE